MAFGTSSGIFVNTLNDILANTTAIDLSGSPDTFYIALFNDTITPDKTVSSANTALGAGQWASGQVSDTTEWPAGGQALDSPALTVASNVIKWDAADEVSTGTSATLADVRGCLIYDYSLATPVDNQGICFLSFGGANAVTDGTFTVVFATAGIFTITV